MRSEEAQIGKRVRVRKDHRKAELRGREGTIAKSWGNPDYPALDVLLDEGDWQLFWFHELEEVSEDDRGTRPQNGATARPSTQDPSPHGSHLVVLLDRHTRSKNPRSLHECKHTSFIL